MLPKQWNLLQPDKDLAAELASCCELHPFLALLLTAQGIDDPDEAMAFLLGTEEDMDPFSFADMDRAVERIRTALEKHEKILVFGDYDVDGITAAVSLYSYLKQKGADVSYRIPLRDNGYGMHVSDIEAAASDGVKLIVTVDNGISLLEEVKLAHTLDVDVVVTDHHQPSSELPCAVAVVDPHRTDCESICKDYAGVGVVFMLLCALEGDGEAIFEEYGDLLALGTLADAMALRGFNRDLIRRALTCLNHSNRPGIRALRRVAGCDSNNLTASFVCFSLVPRMNAAGRVADPAIAAQLLLAEDDSVANDLAAQLQECNLQRQKIGAEIALQAQSRLEENARWQYDRVLVLDGRDWHAGVLGIVAARLSECFGKPAFVLSVGEDGIAHGSGRSQPGFSLFEALHSCQELLVAYGGHEQAAGVTLKEENIPAFREAINRYAASFSAMPAQEIRVAFKLRPEQIDIEKLALMQLLEPFGNGNPTPLFGLYNMKLDNIASLGNGSHMRLSLSRDNVRISVVRFGMSPAQFPVPCGSIVNCIVSLERNEYRGQVNVSIRLRDISYADVDREELREHILQFESLMRREWRPEANAALPTRDQLARLYSLLHRCGSWSGTIEQLLMAVTCAGNGELIVPMSALQLLIALEMWRECDLITLTDHGDYLTIVPVPASGKADLTATTLWKYIERGEEA